MKTSFTLAFALPAALFCARPAQKVPFAADRPVANFINYKLKPLFTPLEYLQTLKAGKDFVDTIEAQTNKIIASKEPLKTLNAIRTAHSWGPEYRKYYRALETRLNQKVPLVRFSRDPLGNDKILCCLTYVLGCSNKLTEKQYKLLIDEIAHLLLPQKQKAPNRSGAFVHKK